MRETAQRSAVVWNLDIALALKPLERGRVLPCGLIDPTLCKYDQAAARFPEVLMWQNTSPRTGVWLIESIMQAEVIEAPCQDVSVPLLPLELPVNCCTR